MATVGDRCDLYIKLGSLGCVLGPLLFAVYCTPVGECVTDHGIHYQSTIMFMVKYSCDITPMKA